MDLVSRVALVTGGGRRVGQALALALAREGMHLAIHYHSSAEGAQDTQARARALGVRAELFPANLEDPARARELPGAVARQFGQLDVLVNSAGIMPQATVEETTPELWDHTMAVNLKSYFFTVQGALAHLRQTKGKVVNLADVGGLEPWPGYTAHCVSKAGVVMLTKTLALALAPDITVNAIAPGAVLPPDDWSDAARQHLVRTTPLKRLGSPDDVAGALVYLLRADYVTGEVLVVDGGRLIR